MKIVSLSADVNAITHINRFVDLAAGKLYIIETVADYALLPQNIITMLGSQWYEVQGLEVPHDMKS